MSQLNRTQLAAPVSTRWQIRPLAVVRTCECEFGQTDASGLQQTRKMRHPRPNVAGTAVAYSTRQVWEIGDDDELP